MPIELCPVAIRVCGKGVRRGKGAGSGFVPYGGKGVKGDGKNGGGAGHDIVAAGGAVGAPLAVPSPFNRTNLRVSVGDSTQPSHVEMTFEMPGSVVVPPSLAVRGGVIQTRILVGPRVSAPYTLVSRPQTILAVLTSTLR